MRIVAFIEEEAVIKKILSHLNLWLPQYHDPPAPSEHYCDSSDISASSSPFLEVEDCEALQLNVFSGRSYEWWEATNMESAHTVNANIRADNHQSDLEYEDSQEDCQSQEELQDSYDDCQRPYEDEFSQEVFYEDWCAIRISVL